MLQASHFYWTVNIISETHLTQAWVDLFEVEKICGRQGHARKSQLSSHFINEKPGQVNFPSPYEL